MHNAVADEADEIATDRPDFVESSNVVGKGRFQVETSVAGDRDSSDGVRSRSFSTPTLLRYGIGDAWEMRVESDGAVRQRTTEAGGAAQNARGFGDLSFGLKWHARDAEGTTPSVGFLLHADVASGSTALRGSGTRPSLRMVAEWELPSDYSMGVMPGLGYDRDAGGTYGILGVVLGKSLTGRLRSFVEFSAPQAARSGHGGTEAAATLGFAYLLTDTCQVDTAMSRGLTRSTPDLSFTVGLSFKL